MQQDSPETASDHYPPVETHLISSTHAARAFKVQVMQPARKKEEATRFPVVYATDGNLAFEMFKGISRVIQSPECDASRFILVGIGYAGNGPYASETLRARDLIFPGYPELSREAPPGGAQNFQHFIEHELIPFIDERYATIPGDRSYFGHSAGGGFGLYTLFTKSDVFKNYIISSPGLIYHGRSPAGVNYENYDFVLQEARRFIACAKPLSDIRVYMSVGTEEEYEPAFAQWQLTSSFYRMTALLKAAAIPGLELMTEAFAGETHLTVWPMAFIHGVRAVFGKGHRS